ncbi:hypothetical protein MP638_002525 [Amoeboaphelidium occidentale]|nr:hypothetical protein MP638_002525 [Amoeboaphelidium occidentale]
MQFSAANFNDDSIEGVNVQRSSASELDAGTLVEIVKHFTEGLNDRDFLLQPSESQVIYPEQKQIIHFLMGHQPYCSMLAFCRLLGLRWEHAWSKLTQGSDDKDRYISALYGVLRVFHHVILFKPQLPIAVKWYLSQWISNTNRDLLNETFLEGSDQVALLRSTTSLKGSVGKKAFAPGSTSSTRSKGTVKVSKKLGKNPPRLLARILGKPVVSFAEYFVVDGADKVAAYLSLVQENLFKDLAWWDLLTVQRWRKDSMLHNSPTSAIGKLIHRSNKLSEWFIWMILLPPLISGRGKVSSAEIIEKMYQLALELYKINNFESLISLLLAIQHPVISRLKSAWKKVNKTVQVAFGHSQTDSKTLEQNGAELNLLKLCSPLRNWTYLREQVKTRILSTSTDEPGMAYFGLYTSDLILNEEAKQDFISSSIKGNEKLINLNKLLFRSKTIEMFCLACKREDIFGNAQRTTYESYFASNFVVNLDVYMACENIAFGLKEMQSSMMRHPKVIKALSTANQVKKEYDVWALSKLIEP